ncbi:MAG: site-specific integrase [Mesorhizobium sp.]|uniref:site-specific integrase n=1 Tax=Mesorhizobium sp. TaxID=1871066 RepID=UPI000FE6181D|nr:site-specific integrase [Mesorhizobium sp.]RWP14864.1 MAG: site-specific integrase [Mesorhizobium sp.]
MATIRKRGTKWQVQIRRQEFPTISRSFLNKGDAAEWARHWEAKADRNDLPTNTKALNSISLGQLVERYRDEVVISKRGAEVETIVLNAFLREPLCRKKLSVLTTADFAIYRDKRLASISATTLARQLAPLSNMFNIAKREWAIPLKGNPLSDLRMSAQRNRRERRLRKGELDRLVLASRTTRNSLILPIILFALETALRRGELLALSWEHIDFERRSAAIPESKNGHSRTIPLTPKAIAIVRNLGRDSKWVFPIAANALRLSWARLTKRAVIEDLHFHDLRHEAISRFFELGLTIPEVASISGHRDVRMLMRYAHADVQRIGLRLMSKRNELSGDHNGG